MVIRTNHYVCGLLLGLFCWATAPRTAEAQGFTRALKPLDDAADMAQAFVAHRFWHVVFVALLGLGLVSYGVLKRTEALWGVLVTGIIYMLYIARDDIFGSWQ